MEFIHVHAQENPVLVKIIPVSRRILFIRHMLKIIHLGADSLVAPLKGIAHEQPVRAVLKYIDTAYIELKPHNLKDGVDGLAGVL